jgi:hypothetical protein
MNTDPYTSHLLSTILAWIIAVPASIGVALEVLVKVADYECYELRKRRGIPWPISAWCILCLLFLSPARYMLFMVTAAICYPYQSIVAFYTTFLLCFYVWFVFFVLGLIGFVLPCYVMMCFVPQNTSPSRVRLAVAAFAGPVLPLIGSLLFSFLLPFAAWTVHWLRAEDVIRATNGPTYYAFVSSEWVSPIWIPVPSYVIDTPRTTKDILRCHAAYLYLSEVEQGRFVHAAYPKIFADYKAQKDRE